MGLIKMDFEISKDNCLGYIYCPEMKNDVIIRSGIFKDYKSDTKDKNHIPSDIGILVDEGQFLIVSSDGKIEDFTSESGYYTFDKKSKPLMLNEKFDDLNNLELNNDINVSSARKFYFINTKEIKGDKFSTPMPISYKDNNLKINVDVKCYGRYTFKVTNPVNFYYSYGSNIDSDYVLDNNFKKQFLEKFLEILNQALSLVSTSNIPYNLLPKSSEDITNAVKSCLKQFYQSQGISVNNVLLSSVTPTVDSAIMIKAIEEDKLYSNSDIINDDSKESVKEVKMFCTNCGEKIIGDIKFCTNCGFQIN